VASIQNTDGDKYVIHVPTLAADEIMYEFTKSAARRRICREKIEFVEHFFLKPDFQSSPILLGRLSEF